MIGRHRVLRGDLVKVLIAGPDDLNRAQCLGTRNCMTQDAIRLSHRKK